MMTQPQTPVPEDASKGGDNESAEPQTFNAPLAALGDGVQEGSTLSVQVVSVDEQAGTATLSLAQPEAEAPAGGTDGMADEFANPSPGTQT